MKIDPIKNGIVIDHIQAGKGMDIYNLLKMEELDCTVALIKNVASKKTGRKDIIKIDADIDLDFEILGYIAPEVTVNIIKEGKTVEKIHPEPPKYLRNVIKCKNPRCITSVEQGIDQCFKLTDSGVYRCIYCESKAKD